jgi:hypothetical protein
MTWYITTSPTGLTCGATRLGHTKAFEIVGLESLYHAVMTADEAHAAGFERCRRATETEAARCVEALETHRWRAAWNQAQAQAELNGWYEVTHEGKRRWAKAIDSRRLQLVDPSGQWSAITTDDLTPGKRIEEQLAEGALRMALMLIVVPKREAAPAKKVRAAAAVSAGPAAPMSPAEYRASYERSINDLNQRTGRRGLNRMSAWS